MGSNLSQAMWPCYSSSYISKRRCIRLVCHVICILNVSNITQFPRAWWVCTVNCFITYTIKKVQHWLTNSCCCKQSHWTIWNLATWKERLKHITSKCKCHDCIGCRPERIKSNLEVTVTSLKQTLNNQPPLPTNAHNRISKCT